MPLFNTHRPRSFADVVGHNREKQIVQRLGSGGRAWWISGKSGIGKTTLANLIAATIADPLNVRELDAGRLTPAALSDIDRESRCYAIGDKPGRCYIVNESHGLRIDAIRELLVMLEKIPGHSCWIFTTTEDGMANFDGIDSAPLLSRCTMLHLTADRQLFAERAKEIAERSGLGGAPLSEYVRLAEFCDDNLRMMLSQIEAGCMMELEVAA